MKVNPTLTITFPETEEAKAITFYKTADNQNVIINPRKTWTKVDKNGRPDGIISNLKIREDNYPNFTTNSKIYKILSLLKDGNYYTSKEIKEKLNLKSMTLSLLLFQLTNNNLIFKTAKQEKIYFTQESGYKASRVKYIINDETLKILQEVEG